MAKDDGGPAYPRSGFALEHHKDAGQCGMSLRDAFAMHALALASALVYTDDLKRSAHIAYAIADAMLAERAK